MAMDAFSASLMKDKREIVIAPTIYKFDTFGAFAEEFKLGERDVVLTNEFIYKPFMEELGLEEVLVSSYRREWINLSDHEEYRFFRPDGPLKIKG